MTPDNALYLVLGFASGIIALKLLVVIDVLAGMISDAVLQPRIKPHYVDVTDAMHGVHGDAPYVPHLPANSNLIVPTAFDAVAADQFLNPKGH